MNSSIKAVIFDMDGVIVDSEPLWRRAMIDGFKRIGVPFTEDDCRKTTGTRFKEVVEMWLAVHQLNELSPSQVEQDITQLLIELIEQEGKPMEMIPELIDFCKSKGLKLGLATSSSHLLMRTVLTKLELTDTFHAVVSAEFMKLGKPHPEVFLICAEQLGVSPATCIVIEDSVNGVIAAKSAQMKVVAVPDPEHRNPEQFAIADYRVETIKETLGLLKTLFL